MCRDDAARSLAAAQEHQAEAVRRHEAELRRVRGAAQLISDELEQMRRRLLHHPTSPLPPPPPPPPPHHLTTTSTTLGGARPMCTHALNRQKRGASRQRVGYPKRRCYPILHSSPDY